MNRFSGRVANAVLALSFALPLASGIARADDDISAEVQQQIATISRIKHDLTPAQKKMDTALAFGVLAAGHDARVAPIANLIKPLGNTDLSVAPRSMPGAGSGDGRVVVDLFGTVGDALASAVVANGGTIITKSSRWGVITATIPVAAVSVLAERVDVRRMKLSAAARTHVGAVTSQGYISHEVNKVVALGVTGAGVKVGVLSDSALPARLAALKASGDLKASATVLPGQDGPDDGSDEGAAMMEIVQDLAPGADLIFATAFTSEAQFADNILALAAAGCKVIVDDVTYFDEGVFQDGIVAQAVNQVTAQGVVYFSSAGNSGSLTKGTSGTWEGDFKSGGAATGTLAGAGLVHNFSPTGTQNFNRLTVATPYVIVNWSDPLGAATNDYDVYVLNANGTSVLGFSYDTQDGTQDPQEFATPTSLSTFPVGARIVIVKYLGATRALHIDTEGGGLQIATSGATFGHNAGASTQSMAATYWNSAKTGTRPFTGMPNTDETYSSDGPRRIFYRADGTAITPDNVLFATGGGVTLQKPDFAAADGVSTKTPGFLPFFGTSAAAPHAAAIAALIRETRPDYSAAQVIAALRATALDSMTTGVDRDSGYGIATAFAAVQYAKTH